MAKNCRKPKRANHGKRPAAHHKRWKNKVKTPR